ncbi:MAG: TRAP transporter small permease [Desulfobacteraceae bacterium]
MALIAGVLLVACVLIIAFEIFMRYFARQPQVWTVEVCEYILFSLAFLGAPWLLREGGHTSVDILVEQLSPKVQGYLGLFSSALGVLISTVIFCFALITSWQCYESGVVVTKTLTIKKHYFLLLIALGYLFLLGEFGRQFFRHLKNVKENT